MTFMPIVNRGSVTRQCYYWCSTTGLAGLSRHCCVWYGLQLHCSKWRTHCTVKFCLYPTVPPLVDNVFDIRNLQKNARRMEKCKRKEQKHMNDWLRPTPHPPPQNILCPSKCFLNLSRAATNKNYFTESNIWNYRKNTDSVKFTDNL